MEGKMELITLFDEFHGLYNAAEKARELAEEIGKHEAVLAEKYVPYFNERKPKLDWHFCWIFAAFPLQDQLRLIDEAVKKSDDSRSFFEKHLLKENQLLKLLKLPEYSPLIRILGFGWSYFINTCDPSQQRRDEHLSEVITAVKKMFQ